MFEIISFWWNATPPDMLIALWHGVIWVGIFSWHHPFLTPFLVVMAIASLSVQDEWARTAPAPSQNYQPYSSEPNPISGNGLPYAKW